MKINNPPIKHPFVPPAEPRLYVWQHGLVWEYRTASINFQNTYLNDEPYNIVETWNIRLGFNAPLFERVNLRYDGHTVKGFTVFGISVTWGYTYDSRPIKVKQAELEKESK